MADSTKAPGADEAPATAPDPRLAELEAENAKLREQLAAASVPAPPARPAGPSFVFNEGMRDELERHGRTVGTNGKRYVGSGTDDAREATLEEFNKAQPKARPAAQQTAKPPARRDRK